MQWSDHALGDFDPVAGRTPRHAVLARASAPGSDHGLALDVLRPDGHGGYASEGEGPPFRSTPYGSPSLVSLGEWVAYIAGDGSSEANGILHLARTEP